MKSDILLDAIGEVSDRFIREAASGRRHIKSRMGTVLAAAAAALMVGVAVFSIPLLNRDTMPVPPDTGLTISEAPAGPVEGESIRWYHNLTITDEATAFESPETVELGVFRDAVFTEEEIQTVVQRLLDTGWEDMTSTNYDGIAVFFSQPDRNPMSLDEIIAEKQEAPTGITDADVERARQFVSDSKLNELIYEKTGVELSMEADMTREAVVFRGYYNGMETNTYIRMSFYENGDLGEAKLYAVIPETQTVPALSLNEAMENAFALILYGGGDDYEAHNVTAARLEYIDGLPYYILTLDEMLSNNNPMEIRALAVDFSRIEANESLLAQWEKQINLP